MKGILDGFMRPARTILAILTIGLALGGTVITSGCTTSTALKLTISANDAQDAAAQTYNAAVALETQAEATCSAALKTLGKPAPTDATQIVSTCAGVNVKIPYDPVLLQKAAGPINALYDGVRAYNAAITATPTGASLTTATTVLAGLFLNVVADLTSAGITVPTAIQTVANQLNGVIKP